MAKGDHSRVGTSVTEQGQNAQQGLNATRANNQNLYGNMNQNYGYGAATDMSDYNSIMNNYQNFMGGASNYGLQPALDTYGNFAKTGGFSPQDIQDIRARSVAPIRADYANAQANVDRQRRLQHGYSPNYTAATAKMARDQAYSTADASTNAEAAIAQLIQQGKLAGAGGLSQTSLGARGQDVSALGGMTNAYGQTPGLMSTTGNQVLQAGNQSLEGQQLQDEIAKMIIQGRLGESQVPGNFQSAMGNVASALGVAGDAASLFNPLKNLFKPSWGNFGAPSGVDTGDYSNPSNY